MDGKDKPSIQREDFKSALDDMGSYVDVSVDDLMQINQRANQHARLRRAERILVKELMTTDVATVTPETAIGDAARILLELRISGLPVVDEHGALIGMITEADFLTALGIPCHHPAHNLWQTLESMFKHEPRVSVETNTVRDLMVTDVITVREDQSLHDAIDMMKKFHIKRLVVADKDNHVRGILTRSNLIKVFLQQLA